MRIVDQAMFMGELSDGLKEDVRDSMRHWDADGQFVLHWGNDYWLDDSGEVTSS